jgi:hypothetical protein
MFAGEGHWKIIHAFKQVFPVFKETFMDINIEKNMKYIAREKEIPFYIYDECNISKYLETIKRCYQPNTLLFYSMEVILRQFIFHLLRKKRIIL